jgi:4-amino-4-deoxy-L-arabinose transferase-like glycosyltransferase
MEDEKMPGYLFYRPAGLGFAIGLVISVIVFALMWYRDNEQQELLEYKRELFNTLAGRDNYVHAIPTQTSIITGRIILEEHRRGVSIDSLCGIVDRLNYAFSFFDNTDTGQSNKKYLISVLTGLGRFPEHLMRLVDDSQLNELLDKPENIETIKMILAKKTPVPEVVYKLPGFPTNHAIYSLLIAQCLAFFFFIIRISWNNEVSKKEDRWRDAPWGKPGTLILVVPGCLVWIVIYGIVIFFGNDWLERVKNRRKETKGSETATSGERLKKLSGHSDEDTKNLAQKLQQSIQKEM